MNTWLISISKIDLQSNFFMKQNEIHYIHYINQDNLIFCLIKGFESMSATMANSSFIEGLKGENFVGDIECSHKEHNKSVKHESKWMRVWTH